MTDKPYAWINAADEYKIIFDENFPTAYPNAWIPLYTHPVKELTDEEIAQVASEYFLSKYIPSEFARAILRKAQEK